MFLLQLVRVSPDQCALEYKSGRKVTKSVHNRSDVDYIGQFLQVIHS